MRVREPAINVTTVCNIGDKEVNFEEALRAMREGKKIRRAIWQSNDYMDTNKFMNERRKDGGLSDLIANDWEVVE